MKSISTSAPSELVLPFKTLPSPSQTQVIGNSTIGQISLPKESSLRLGELLAYREFLAGLDEQNMTAGERDSAYRVAQVTILFQSRVHSGWTEEHTKAPWSIEVGGKTQTIHPSEVLVDLICDFFLSHLNRWRPHTYSAMIEGGVIDVARSMAIATAQKEKLAVVTNDNEEARATFYLFGRDLIPKGGTPRWRVIEDFCEETDAPEAEESHKKK